MLLRRARRWGYGTKWRVRAREPATKRQRTVCVQAPTAYDAGEAVRQQGLEVIYVDVVASGLWPWIVLVLGLGAMAALAGVAASFRSPGRATIITAATGAVSFGMFILLPYAGCWLIRRRRPWDGRVGLYFSIAFVAHWLLYAWPTEGGAAPLLVLIGSIVSVLCMVSSDG